jgi:hypothetical protein
LARKLANCITAIQRMVDQQRRNLPRLRLCARLTTVLPTAKRITPAQLCPFYIDLIQHPN